MVGLEKWQRVGILIQVLGSFVGGLSHCMGWEKLEIQGEGLVRYLQLHLHQEDSVMVGEDLVYSLTVTPFINSVSCLLCQPPFWGCQSRPKLVPQEAEAAKAKGSCSHYWRRHIHFEHKGWSRF